MLNNVTSSVTGTLVWSRPSTGSGAAQHQLALPLSGGGRTLRAARRALARPARHGLPGQQRLGGRRPGAPARPGGRAGPTSSRCGRRTTGGPMPPMRSPPRSPTTRNAVSRVRTGCTPSRRRIRIAASTAARTRRYARGAAADVAGWPMRADRRRPSCAEPFFGNAGGVALPDGYLAEVYAATRAAGGLCIADEMQVGYGRLGDMVLGVRAAGRHPRHRHGRQGDGKRPSPGRGHHDAGDRRRVPRRRATSSPRPAAARSAAPWG